MKANGLQLIDTRCRVQEGLPLSLSSTVVLSFFLSCFLSFFLYYFPLLSFFVFALSLSLSASVPVAGGLSGFLIGVAM